MPAGIERKLVCNKEVCLEAIQDYQTELDRCGYGYQPASGTSSSDWQEETQKGYKAKPSLQSGRGHQHSQGGAGAGGQWTSTSPLGMCCTVYPIDQQLKLAIVVSQT